MQQKVLVRDVVSNKTSLIVTAFFCVKWLLLTAIIALGKLALLTAIFYTKKAVTINKVLLLTTSLELLVLLELRHMLPLRPKVTEISPTVGTKDRGTEYANLQYSSSVSLLLLKVTSCTAYW
jgi:hypothetical protein